MIRDLIPWNWNRSRNLPLRHDEDMNPFLTLHREMNRLFDEAFRGFGLAPVGFNRFLDRPTSMGWPKLTTPSTSAQRS
jgi:HSP20 family protein